MTTLKESKELLAKHDEWMKKREKQIYDRKSGNDSYFCKIGRHKT